MLRKIFVLTLSLISMLILAACAMSPSQTSEKAVQLPTLAPPTVTPMPEIKIPADLQPQADKAAQILAQSLKVPADKVDILEVEAVQWSDTSLGCPEPGMMYAQVITPGYRARALVDGQEYWVHMDEQGNGVQCSSDIAREPVGNKQEK